MNAVVHIAGFPVLVGRHGRQLCAWCGSLLFEVTGDEMGPIKADGSPPDPMRPWEMGRLIEVTKDGPCTGYVLLPHVDGEELPRNACAKAPLTLRVIR